VTGNSVGWGIFLFWENFFVKVLLKVFERGFGENFLKKVFPKQEYPPTDAIPCSLNHNQLK
jgi:hypothetical protein